MQRGANALTEAFFEGSERISARSILCKIKGRSRLRARPAHKAPQCGAFHEFKTAVGFSLSRTVPQSVLRKVSVCQAFAAFLTAPVERKWKMNEDNKRNTTLWLRPSTLQRMDSWLAEDNCQSRSEFTEKALRFYMGYLGSCDTTEYLSKALVTVIRGTLENHNNRLRSLLFKWCVELNMMCHTIAAHFRADPIDRRELRAYAIDEVKRTNGQISFSNAIDIQRRLEPEGEWSDED